MEPITLVLDILNSTRFHSLSITFTEEDILNIIARLPFSEQIGGHFYCMKNMEVTSVTIANHHTGEEQEVRIYEATIHEDEIQCKMAIHCIFVDIEEVNKHYLTDLFTLNYPELMPAATKKRNVAKALRNLPGNPTESDFIAIARDLETNSRYVKQVYQDVSKGTYTYL